MPLSPCRRCGQHVDSAPSTLASRRSTLVERCLDISWDRCSDRVGETHGQLVLDPLIAIAVAINISVTGLQLFRETASGLMDHSLPELELQSIEAYLNQRSGNGIDFHALRTRVAGSRRFISLHVLVPGGWSVKDRRRFEETIEREIAELIADSRRVHPSASRLRIR